MRPVQVGIHPEHLAEDGLASLKEIRGETAALPDPVLSRLWDGSAKGWVVGVGDACWVGGEDGGVIDLA